MEPRRCPSPSGDLIPARVEDDVRDTAQTRRSFTSGVPVDVAVTGLIHASTATVVSGVVAPARDGVRFSTRTANCVGPSVGSVAGAMTARARGVAPARANPAT